MGDTLFVNGAAQPYFQVSTHKYRFRILNGSNARYYTFSLSNGATITQIGTEAGLLSKPYSQSSITLGASRAGRRRHRLRQRPGRHVSLFA